MSQSTDPDEPRRGCLRAVFWNDAQHRLRTVWRLLIGLIVWGLLAAGATGMALLAGQPWLQWPGLLAVTLLMMVLAARLIDRRPMRSYGLRMDGHWYADLGLGLLLGAALMAGIYLVQAALGWIAVVDTWQTLPDRPFALSFLHPVTLFVCVGIYEELLFRGYLLPNLAEGTSWGWLGGNRGAVAFAVSLGAVVFGVLHLTNPNATLLGALNITLAGLLMGLSYALTERLGLAIGLHITWNLFQGNVFGFPVSGVRLSPATVLVLEQNGPQMWTGGAFGPEGGLLATIALITGAILVVLWVQVRYGRVALTTSLAQPPNREIDRDV